MGFAADAFHHFGAEVFDECFGVVAFHGLKFARKDDLFSIKDIFVDGRFAVVDDFDVLPEIVDEGSTRLNPRVDVIFFGMETLVFVEGLGEIFDDFIDLIEQIIDASELAGEVAAVGVSEFRDGESLEKSLEGEFSRLLNGAINFLRQDGVLIDVSRFIGGNGESDAFPIESVEVGGAIEVTRVVQTFDDFGT